MENYLQYEFLNNTIQAWLIVAGVILFGWLIKKFISKYLAGLLFRLFAKAGRTFHKQSFLQLILGPLETFLLLLIAVIAADNLRFPALFNVQIHRINSQAAIKAIVNAALVITFINLCIRVIKYIALIMGEKANKTLDQTGNQLIIFFADFFKVLLIILGILLVLKFSFDYNITNLLTGLSIVGAAIALATKESLENLIASFIIFFDKPFIIGDTVKVLSFTGTVEKIGLRSTRIRTDQKTYITVPNKQMVDTVLDNITMRTQRKAELRLQLNLSTTTEQMRTAIIAVKNILQKPEIENTSVFVSDTGGDAHVITVEYFTSMFQTIDAFNTLREQVNLEIIDMLTKSNIQFAEAVTSIALKKEE